MMLCQIRQLIKVQVTAQAQSGQHEILPVTHSDAAAFLVDAADDITRDQGKDLIHDLLAVYIKMLQGH
jgi:hypothetical protein